MGLLVEKFYDPVNIRFKTSSLIDIQDGRLAPLLNKKYCTNHPKLEILYMDFHLIYNHMYLNFLMKI